MTNLHAGNLDSRPADRPRWIAVLEGAAVFLLGCAVMHYLYAASVQRAGREIGAPEHDSYYHIAMASMLPEHGLMVQFPWLRFTYFRDQGDDFVSHHWGFHALLLPFVKAAEWLHGDALRGGRWALCAISGANLLVFHLLLRQRRVPLHWLWIALYVLLPDQYFARHGYVRAIGASYLFMQLLLLALFARRYVLTGLVLLGYVHLYLGAVLYGPVIVATYALACVTAPRGERVWPWRMVAITAGAWALGVVTYPYSAGMFEFLRMQVFDTGLSPDIEVGLEWLPYTDAWFIATMAAPLLIAWVAALTLRLRFGPRLETRDLVLVLLNFAFLLLTFKARRFIEYWPPICLLCAAYLACEPLAELMAAADRWWAGRRRWVAAALGILGSGAILALIAWRMDADVRLSAEWRLWLFLGLALLLPRLCRIWRPGANDRGSLLTHGAVPVIAGGLIAAGLGLLVAFAANGNAPPPRIEIPVWAWGVLAASYALVPLMWVGDAGPRARPVTSTVAAICIAVTLPVATLAAGSKSLGWAAAQLRCFYDLPAIRDLMAFLKANSQRGDVVFTDDWDIFPVFFYHNRHNHYIVGLDPKFTHRREPDLWMRYVKISRGQVPSAIRPSDGGAALLPVELDDIREHFGARFVVADRDHRALAGALDARPDLAEFVYPGESYDQARMAEYVVFRIRTAEEAAQRRDNGGVTSGELLLSRVAPRFAQQEFGELGMDRSVDQNVIRLGGVSYARGIGTHATSRLEYDIPRDFARFEAIVGVDDETNGLGSVVLSVELDGRVVYTSPVLRGHQSPVRIEVPLRDARRIALCADSAGDGNRFDHVSWANARLLGQRAGADASAAALTDSDSK